MISRHFEEKYINQILKPNRVLVLYGPRRVGKTTSLQIFKESYQGKVFFQTGEDSDLRRILATESVEQYKLFFSQFDLLIIDEAQLIPNVGRALKIIVDQIKDIQVIASGSSSFELANQVGEPLTGRHEVYTMYPISLFELKSTLSNIELDARLPYYLVYGTYPEVLTLQSNLEKEKYLNQLSESLLYKDILVLEDIKNADKLNDLLRLIAFQVGSQVSLNELSNALDISKQTVSRYIDLLEKAFVIIKVRGFSKNLRKEVTKTNRYYFYDNGILNAILNNFNPVEIREDVGRLWENFLFIERLKKREYQSIQANSYFWRTYDKKEIDLVEEREGLLYGYEFKWNKDKATPPSDWLKSYKNAKFEVVSRNNYLNFIT